VQGFHKVSAIRPREGFEVLFRVSKPSPTSPTQIRISTEREIYTPRQK
jgi:hypothetical protein